MVVQNWADPSINDSMIYLGRFSLDSTRGEVSGDGCHATEQGEDLLGLQALAFFSG